MTTERLAGDPAAERAMFEAAMDAISTRLRSSSWGYDYPLGRQLWACWQAARAASPVAGSVVRHKFWGAGEPDCPQDLKASNGELHTLRCKVCGDGWRKSVDVCFAASPPSASKDVVAWRTVEADGQPPCDGETVFVGINTNGFTACFNEVTATGACCLRGPEQSVCQMSGLRWWRVLDRPDNSEGPAWARPGASASAVTGLPLRLEKDKS